MRVDARVSRSWGLCRLSLPRVCAWVAVQLVLSQATAFQVQLYENTDPPYLVNPCLNISFASLPFCNTSLPIDERIHDAIARMTLDDKIANLVNRASAIPSLGLSVYDWWSEATHGVASARIDGSTPFTTNFPFPITTAMSFNRTLWFKTGNQIGREARAAMNVGNAFSTFWAPVVNLARDPRWGRNLETPGEDPYLSGEYATFFVRGVQESSEDPNYLQASACCKHYVANELESSTEAGVSHSRFEFDATINMQDLVDSYLLPFQTCVEKGRVSGLMCSYNSVNGVPSCANSWLLTTVAREQWNFDGYITSDCDADDDVYSAHHFTATPQEAVAAVLKAGTDVDCGTFVADHAHQALNDSLISEKDIDQRLYNLFRVRMRLAHFDVDTPLQRIGVDQICSDYATQLARDATAQSVALVKNVANTLPISLSSSSLLAAFSSPTIALIGPNVMLGSSIAGYYGPSHVCNNKMWTMLDAVKVYATGMNQVQYSVGVPNVTSDDRSLIPAAVHLASQVDVVVLVVGSDLTVAQEGQDAVNLTYSVAQLDLIAQVSKAARSPVIVISLTAVPFDITTLLSDFKIGAILHAGQPSVTQLGIADVLFGAKSPAGRLVQTIYPASYANQVSIFDFNMRPGPSSFPRPDCPAPYTSCVNGTNPGRTYRFYIDQPVLPFGYGLSYTSFTYTLITQPSSPVDLKPLKLILKKLREQNRLFFPVSDVSFSLEQRADGALAGLQTITGEPVAFAVNVTNTGTTDADDAVLGFYVPPHAGKNGIPLQVLFGFDRVHVPAGETVTVWLLPALMDFTVVDETGQRQVNGGDYRVSFGVESTLPHGMGFVETILNAA